MHIQLYESLNWAYQLHYYICFRSHCRRALFSSSTSLERLTARLLEICRRHDYHVLQSKWRSNQVRLLVSLRPDQAISKVIQTLKPNLVSACDLESPVWARGFLAKSTGRVNRETVRQYLLLQTEHHGYAQRLAPPVFRYRTQDRKPLRSAHAFFDLSHHVVLATQSRRSVFGASTARALGAYWLKVAEKRGFAIDQMSILPDHGHLLMRIVPKTSVESCVLSLMNNGQHFMAQHFPEILVRAGMDQLWESSAYAGTCGEFTTALMRTFLRDGS
ncbi:MAG: IS200/IS605 family transposase [Acidobacteriia bacterium]|nr:IS200/IS605 family transposase [Terriglobia bacterium]